MALSEDAIDQLLVEVNKQLATCQRVVANLLCKTVTACKDEMDSCRPDAAEFWRTFGWNGQRPLDGRWSGDTIEVGMIDLLRALCPPGVRIEPLWEHGVLRLDRVKTLHSV